MTNKEKIKYLMRYTKITSEIKLIKNSYELYYEKIYTTPTAKLSDMPKGSNVVNDKIGIDVSNLEQLRESLSGRIHILQSIRNEIQNKIWDLQDPTHRMLMSLRYLDGLKWEEICVKLNYSWKNTHRLHSRALQLIDLCSIDCEVTQ